MSSLTNLAQGMALAIISSVFATGTIETEVFVAKHFLAIVDGYNCFAVNRFVFLFSAINASLISAISLLLELKILFMPGLVTLLKLDRICLCPFRVHPLTLGNSILANNHLFAQDPLLSLAACR